MKKIISIIVIMLFVTSAFVIPTFAYYGEYTQSDIVQPIVSFAMITPDQEIIHSLPLVPCEEYITDDGLFKIRAETSYDFGGNEVLQIIITGVEGSYQTGNYQILSRGYLTRYYGVNAGLYMDSVFSAVTNARFRRSSAWLSRDGQQIVQQEFEQYQYTQIDGSSIYNPLMPSNRYSDDTYMVINDTISFYDLQIRTVSLCVEVYKLKTADITSYTKYIYDIGFTPPEPIEVDNLLQGVINGFLSIFEVPLFGEVSLGDLMYIGIAVLFAFVAIRFFAGG